MTVDRDTAQRAVALQQWFAGQQVSIIRGKLLAATRAVETAERNRRRSRLTGCGMPEIAPNEFSKTPRWIQADENSLLEYP
jgi:hypothetical protein